MISGPAEPVVLKNGRWRPHGPGPTFVFQRTPVERSPTRGSPPLLGRNLEFPSALSPYIPAQTNSELRRSLDVNILDLAHTRVIGPSAVLVSGLLLLFRSSRGSTLAGCEAIGVVLHNSASQSIRYHPGDVPLLCYEIFTTGDMGH